MARYIINHMGSAELVNFRQACAFGGLVGNDEYLEQKTIAFARQLESYLMTANAVVIPWQRDLYNMWIGLEKAYRIPADKNGLMRNAQPSGESFMTMPLRLDMIADMERPPEDAVFTYEDLLKMIKDKQQP